jgi:organic radical activating enzyme
VLAAAQDINDDWLVDEILEAIPLIAKETGEIGFTGGEPTLLGDRLLRLVSDMKAHLPNTACTSCQWSAL